MAGPLTKLLIATSGALDRRFGWDRLPLPLGVFTLAGLRTRLREQNLYDTGTRRRDAVRPTDALRTTRGRLDGTYNDLGSPRWGARRPASAATSRSSTRSPSSCPAARPEPARRQPRAADARRVHPGDDAEPARRRVDPVRGARLVQPRPEPARGAVGARARRRRPVAGAADEDPSARRADPTADPTGGRRPGSRTDSHWWDGSQIYGSEPAFADALRDARGRQAADRRATACCRATSTRTLDYAASPGTTGSGSRSCTRSSRSSTTRSATGSPPSTRRGPTTSCSTKARLDQRGADGEDPHGRVDAGDHRAPDDEDRDARELVGPRSASASQAVRPAQRQRGAQRHPRLARPTTTACRTR